MEDPSQFVLKTDCEHQHKETRRHYRENARRVWWLAGILVGLSALMLAAVGQGWSAVNRANAVEEKVKRVEQTVESRFDYVEKTLGQIHTDVREIRASQQAMLRGNPNK